MAGLRALKQGGVKGFRGFKTPLANYTSRVLASPEALLCNPKMGPPQPRGNLTYPEGPQNSALVHSGVR